MLVFDHKVDILWTYNAKSACVNSGIPRNLTGNCASQLSALVVVFLLNVSGVKFQTESLKISSQLDQKKKKKKNKKNKK